MSLKPGAQFRQARLFNPVGMHAGSPWKLHPDTWVEDESRGPVVWHATDDQTLSGVDRPHTSPSFQGYRPESDDVHNEWYRDTTGNRVHRDDFDGSVNLNDAGYGSALGMHFGTQRAADERADSVFDSSREWIHSARIPSNRIVSSSGHGPSSAAFRPADDDWANVSPHADKLVHQGKALAYKNNAEDEGSTSYRVKPEHVRTWGEDVMESPTAHPALKHLAQQGYNPAVNRSEEHERRMATKWGMSKGGEQGTLWEYETAGTGTLDTQPTGFHATYEDALSHKLSSGGDRVIMAAGTVNANLSQQQQEIAARRAGNLPIQPKLVKTGRREGR